MFNVVHFNPLFGTANCASFIKTRLGLQSVVKCRQRILYYLICSLEDSIVTKMLGNSQFVRFLCLSLFNYHFQIFSELLESSSPGSQPELSCNGFCTRVSQEVSDYRIKLKIIVHRAVIVKVAIYYSIVT